MKKILNVFILVVGVCLLFVVCQYNTDGNKKISNNRNSHDNLANIGTTITSQNEPLVDRENNAIGASTSDNVDSVSSSAGGRDNINTDTINQSLNKESSSINSNKNTPPSSPLQNDLNKTEYGIVLPDDERT